MKLVVFDVDGTLVDSQAQIVGAMRRAMDQAGLPELTRAHILSIVGLSLPEAVARLLPDTPATLRDVVVAGYRTAFMERRIESEAPLFPGMGGLIDRLAAREDLLLGVATGKSRRGLDAMLDHHGLRRHFVTLQTADGHPSKPHPEMLLSACAAAGIAPERAVMIGDTEYDIQMAAAAGCAAIGVEWGYHPADALRRLGAPVAADTAALDTMIGEWADD
ncbi:MAG: HAD-IA family hydrolase [Paracoccus sp. (in: a-proteobacteria)]|nr:HAD-IA family hydrolase [Paracoccus sp. (in: a-proteobacteria)]